MSTPRRAFLASRAQQLACVALLVTATLATASDISGAERYALDCAGCHGEKARVDGPQASDPAIVPPNLRRLTAPDGSFPADDVRRVIDGRDLPPAHGTVAMPAWGQAYNRSLAGQGERRVQERLDALVEYLRTIQEPPNPSGDTVEP